MSEKTLNTEVLPEYNCSNCKYFLTGDKRDMLIAKGLESTGNRYYAVECSNIVHPLLDCILRGFKAHSKQPSHLQTLNKKLNDWIDFETQKPEQSKEFICEYQFYGNDKRTFKTILIRIGDAFCLQDRTHINKSDFKIIRWYYL